MKQVASLLLLGIIYLPLSAQYFFTGEVKGSHGDNLQHVSVIVQSSGEVYRTGSSGSFEIVSRRMEDSVTFIIDGYQRYSTAITTSEFLRVTLKEQPLSFTPRSSSPLSMVNGRSVSFACNGNGIAYSNVKRFLDMGIAVPSEAVKLEEMTNYLNLYYEDPDDDGLFHCSSEMLTCPWNTSHRLLCLNICARKPPVEQATPSNIVLVIDVTGSMDMPNKLPLVKSALHAMIRCLRETDTVSIVEYGGHGRVLAGLPGRQQEVLLRTIEQLSADGPPPGETAMSTAFRVAESQFIPGGNNRIMLITDGDISATSEARRQLAEQAAQHAADSIHLSCFGFGLKKDEPSELPYLARAGGGTFGCVESQEEGESILLDEVAKGLTGIAEKVCYSVSFDTASVEEYHLLGFENRHDTAGGLSPGMQGRPDSTLPLRTFQGSSVSSGNARLALFEIVPKKNAAPSDYLAEVRINYCLPGSQQTKSMSYPCLNKNASFESAAPPLKKAICMALLAMKLKGSECTARLPWSDIDKMTRKIFSSNDFIDREYLGLLTKARKIYEH